MDSKMRFKEAQFGLMIHFGLYSLLAGEWKGKRMPYIAEWIQAYFRIPNREYHELAKVFNPIYFDTGEYVKLAKAAGMKYLVFTSKHHDGFALFHSKASKFNVVDMTPFGRDVVGELAEACYKYDLKLGLYYSQDIDWSHPHGGGYKYPCLNLDATTSWTNDWDFPDNESKCYDICYEEKIKPQLEEILTNYGEIFLIWFDTPLVISRDKSLELYNMVKHYQPNCLVNSRLGNGIYDYVSTGDNEIPEEKDSDVPYESPATLNDTWGFKYYDNNWKGAEEVFYTKEHLKRIGANYLLNIGPDHLGRIPAPAIKVLNELATMQ